MTTNPKDQKAQRAPDSKSLKQDLRDKAEEPNDFQMPDRNYHHDTLENPYTENIDEMGHNQPDNNWQDMDEENGNLNGQNQDSVNEELEDED